MPIRIRKMLRGEEQTVSSLVMASFLEHVAPGYDREGIENFSEFVSPEKLGSRNTSGHFTLVAEFDGELSGMLQIRLPSHLLMLFVAIRFQKRGVARKLLESALGELAKLDEPPGQVTVNSSPFAVPVYERLGFQVRGSEKTEDGMRIVPMMYRLAESR